eukprot:CAMPEP_0198144252 /NCGR_PEP_ID=MMETSP1443-20131203/14335_1 /TAXON_ID=186043 /ORGANISM="Entomoneis sp., Strain CCMP2396" /LENGTH=313 /DNA_ID=CAMNT_0043807613 /DNA_START=59 /DNA_END=997 /DNA_ORIENTATION=+
MAAAAKHFDISQLPSLKNGMSVEDEAVKRRKTCRFIEEAGRVLKLPRVAISTAEVFFHRFYAKHSFADHDRFEVAVACIVLSAKTEESPRKLNHVIDECYKLKLGAVQAGRISAGGASAVSTSSTALDPKSQEFSKLKQRILLLERVILHSIGFELSIDHPYKFLVDLIKKLVQKRKVEYINPAPNMSPPQLTAKLSNELVQNAMNLANDSMQTSLCLQFPPKDIAVATVYLAGNFAKVKPATKGADWIEVLGNPDVESLASISLQIIELIVDRKGVNQEAFQKVKNEINRLKERDSGADYGDEKPPAPEGPD